MNDDGYVPFAGVVRAEVLFNAKRALPYVVAAIFSGNALLWWGWGPAASRGWAVNSDFFMTRLFVAFSFMTLPLFVAVFMGDVITRDFDAEIDRLIFSKPIRRLEYLLGKFLGNFLVLAACQAAFSLTLASLQGFRRPGMLMLAPRVVPFVQHFIFFTLLSSLPIAAVCFAVGALTRNVKVVYGMTAGFYCAYIALQNGLKAMSVQWRILLDPLLMNVEQLWRGKDVNALNQMVMHYDGWLIANRVGVVVAAASCIALVNLRFTTRRTITAPSFATLDATRESRPIRESASFGSLDPFIAAVQTELRLLRDERSFGAAAAIAVIGCIATVAAFPPANAADYVVRVADPLLLFLFSMSLFYTGESIHRDRTLRVAPLLWSAPVSNASIVVAKVAATSVAATMLSLVVIVATALLQITRGQMPDLTLNASVFGLILIPNLLFLVSAASALQCVIQQKQSANAIGIALAGVFYYAVTHGSLRPTLNFLLLNAWTAQSLGTAWLVVHRVYTCGVAALLITIAIAAYERKR